MAKRSYKTELGCIACDELGELGAGKPHWLVETPHVLCAIDNHSILLANRSTILLLSWSSNSAVAPPLKIRPDLSPIDAESITALEWLAFRDHRVIVAGTSSGYLLLYSLRGDLIHRQVMFLLPLRRLVRCVMIFRENFSIWELEDVCVLFSWNDVIVWIQRGVMNCSCNRWDLCRSLLCMCL